MSFSKGPWVTILEGSEDTGDEYVRVQLSKDEGWRGNEYMALSGVMSHANGRLIGNAPELYETLKALVSEFGCTIDLYKMLGPHYTHKDGTQVFEISTVLDREPLIEKASALLARIDGATPRPPSSSTSPPIAALSPCASRLRCRCLCRGGRL